MPVPAQGIIAVELLAAIASEVMSITFECPIEASIDERKDEHERIAKMNLDCGMALELSAETSCYILVVAWALADAQTLEKILQGPGGGDSSTIGLNDVLGEGLNIVAGQIKSQLALDHALSLPGSLAGAHLRAWHDRKDCVGVWLQAGAQPQRFFLTVGHKL